MVNTDSSGAVVCATPSFAGETTVEARESGVSPDRECGFCSRLLVEILEDGELAYPLAIQTEEMEPKVRPSEGTRRLSITAFAEEMEIWDDEGAYDASFDSEAPHFAARSLIPTGTFPPDFGSRRRFLRRKRFEQTAHALLTGVVKEGSMRRNSATQREFAWAVVESFGASYDLVAPSAAVPGGFTPENVVQATCWLVGRSTD